jgi:hypothetical protein
MYTLSADANIGEIVSTVILLLEGTNASEEEPSKRHRLKALVSLFNLLSAEDVKPKFNVVSGKQSAHH